MRPTKRILGDKSNYPKANPDLTARLIEQFGKDYVPKVKEEPVEVEVEPTSSLDNITASLVDFGDFWRVDRVQYRNEIYVVDLAKALLEGGDRRTQYKWAKHSEAARIKNEFHTPDYPIFYGLAKSLYSLREGRAKAEIARAQKFLKDSLFENKFITLTRVKYLPHGQDVIIHNFGTKEIHGEGVNFIGPDGRVTNLQNTKPCQRLLGTKDNLQEINNVFQWLSGTGTYLWRVNSKPDKVDERVACFDAYSDKAILDCVWDPADPHSSIGVRIAKCMPL